MSLLPHITGLGFYSDDWDLLARLQLAPGQRFVDLFHALYHAQVRMRPGQVAYLVGLYRLFGLEPTGYHLANAAVVILMVLTFHLVLLRIVSQRAISVAIPLLYAVLPHYSTARIWYASFQAPLSVLLYFTSLLAGLRSLDHSARHPVMWQVVSLLTLAASTLSYEVCLLLFLLNTALFARRAVGPARIRGVVLAALTLATTLAVVVFKVMTATKVIAGPEAGYSLGLIRRILWVDGDIYGLALPRTLWRAARLAGSLDVMVAILLAISASWYLGKTIAEESKTAVWAPWGILLGGVVVAACGVGMFLVTPVSFHETGANTRIAIASAAGVAMVMVGLIAGLTARLSSTMKTYAFAWGIGGLIGANALISGSIATQWVQAAERAHVAIKQVTAMFPTLRHGTTVLVSGICPYVGPAIVFESFWDLRGALWLHYRDTTLKANILTSSATISSHGVHTRIYASQTMYPYDSILAVDVARATARPLRDSVTAAAYLNRLSGEGPACPPGHEGYGVRIF